MVIRVYVEGGTHDVNVSAATMCNVAALREELNRFMSSTMRRDDITIVVNIAAGYKNAAKTFAENNSERTYLYVDLDRKPEKRDEWFTDLADDGLDLPQDCRDRVFFWIQEMEAWFLKQPMAIEEWAEEEGFKRKPNKTQNLSEHKSIKGKDIEQLASKASYILYNILKQTYFSSNTDKHGKPTKLLYGKLAHAPGLISHLDPTSLLQSDKELRTFANTVNTTQAKETSG